MATTSEATDLGSVLRQHRKRLGLRPERVAVELDLSVKSVTQWELNKRLPTLTQLSQLAHLFGVPIGELASADLKASE